jgi:CubicO group peptidase (beta-lactamase class C family)
MLNRLVRRSSLLAGFALASASPALSQGTALTAKLDSLAAGPVAQKRAVGLVAAVVRGRDTLLFKSYGKADVEGDVALPLDAMFEVGSVAKQFTAAAILQLRDAGRLSLDDDVTKWLPDFDTRGNKVPLRRLLDHTSGMMGLTEMREFGELVNNDKFPRDSAYALIKRYPFQFPTGTAQIYNNSAFWLLGLVVEKASGMSYEDYVEKKIFAPLGMSRSMYCHSEEKVDRRALGHNIEGTNAKRARINVHTWPFAAGSICSTAGDLVTWVRALHGGKVLSPKSYAEMVAPAKLNDGTPTRYGMGIGVGKDARGIRYIGHGGTINGFRAEVNWYPDAELAVVVLVNATGGIDPGGLTGALAGQVVPWSDPAPKTFSGNAAALVGTYKGPSRGRDMVVVVTTTPEGVAFSANGSPARVLPWIEGLTFQGGAALLSFSAIDAATGAPGELRFDAGGGGYYILKRQ